MNLTRAEIDALIAKLQTYKYVCSVGGTVIGPLKTAPQIEADVETMDITLYETGTEVQASILTRNNVRLTLDVEDVDAAISLLSSFKQGDNILATANSKVITLVPITDDENAKTITFGNAFLQPGLSTTLAEGDDPNSVTLTYLCRPTVDSSGESTGKPFAYGDDESSSSN